VRKKGSTSLTKCLDSQFWTLSSMKSSVQKNEIESPQRGTACKFQNYIEKVD
jgi:hypothetical protein